MRKHYYPGLFSNPFIVQEVQKSCSGQNRHYIVPSLSIIRDILIRVDPMHLDCALQCWNQTYGQHDESLAIDGKTMCNAIDDQGYQAHIMSAIGHQTKTCYTQKK